MIFFIIIFHLITLQIVFLLPIHSLFSYLTTQNSTVTASRNQEFTMGEPTEETAKELM